MKDGAYADFKIFTGNSNPELAEEVASIMGKPLGKATVSKFSDGEISVNLWETVRGIDTYIIQTRRRSCRCLFSDVRLSG
jgi:ribose-phosphate pyrophosphokinase